MPQKSKAGCARLAQNGHSCRRGEIYQQNKNKARFLHSLHSVEMTQETNIRPHSRFSSFKSRPPVKRVACNSPIRAYCLPGSRPRKFCQLQITSNGRLTAAVLLVLSYRLTRKRVYVFFDRHLFVLHVLAQLIPYIFCYLLRIFSYRVNVIALAPKLSSAVFVF